MAQSACRLLHYTSLVFGTSSYTALELVSSGLNTSQDDALAVCIADPAYHLDLANFKLREVLRGGSQFQLSETRDWRIDASQPVTFTSLPQLLRQDSLLAASPRPAWQYPWANRAPEQQAFAAEFPGIFDLDETTAAGRLARALQPDRVHPWAAHTCFIAHGLWRRDVRYQVSFDVTHPASSRATKAAPAIWTAPLKHTRNDTSGNYTLNIVGPTKWGTVCTPPPHRQTALGTAFDACAAAGTAGLALPQPATPAACVAALQARMSALRGADTPEAAAALRRMPFTAPPLAATYAQGAAAEGGCPQGSIWSARASGECVRCTHGTLTQVAPGKQTCTCKPSTVRTPIGTEACSPPVYVGAAASTPATLAGDLCTHFKQEFNAMLDGTLPAEVAALEYEPAFLQLAAPAADADTLWSLHEAYYATMLADPRYPHLPTRERGVWHTCSKCSRDGWFWDERTGALARSEDWRFRAAHAFRFIGWALHRIGAPCRALWDHERPGHVNYGAFDPKPCAPLPDMAGHHLEL